MEDQFLDNAYRLFKKGTTVLLACSGGADSVALFHLLTKSDIVFSVAHVNYQLRGKESDEDEKFVKNLCQEKGVSCFVRKVSIDKTGKSIQNEAREIRFQFFNELLSQHKIDFLVTAHHQDDLAENSLFRFMRGSGLKGLTSFGETGDAIRRPLIPFRKEDLVNYLSENKLDYRQDASNLESNYTRNKIRNEVLPLIEKDLPNIGKRIAHTTSLLADDYSLLQAFFKPFKEEIQKGSFRMACGHVLAKESSFWFQLIDGMNSEQARQLANACVANDGMYQLSLTNWFIFIVKDIVSISQAAPVRNVKQVFLIPERKNLKYALTDSATLSVTFEPGNSLATASGLLVLNADNLNFPLTVRHAEEGDKFQPLGMQGNKLLSDFYNGLKIPAALKEKEWVLVDAEADIIAVLPHRISEKYKLVESARSKLLVVLNLNATS